MPSGKKVVADLRKIVQNQFEGVVVGTYIYCLSPYNEQGKQFEVTGSKYDSKSDQCLQKPNQIDLEIQA